MVLFNDGFHEISPTLPFLILLLCLHIFTGEEVFREQVQSMDDIFVETEGFRQAKDKLEKNHYVLITGSSGDGKSLIGMKLVANKIAEGYTLKEIDNISQWREHVRWKKPQIVFVDDIVGPRYSTENDDNQKLINQIGLINYERVNHDNLLYVVMTCRKGVLSRIKPCITPSKVLEENNIVDLSEIMLSQSERLEMLEKHLIKNRKDYSMEQTVKQAIIKCKYVAGFPNSVHMFTLNDKLFGKGKQFFNSPIENVRNTVHVLHRHDPDVYALLVFLLIKDGEIKEKTIHQMRSESNEFFLLQNIVHFPSVEQLSTRLQSALDSVDQAFVTKEGSTIQFRHSCVLEAMCLSFSQTLQHEAIKWLPFTFICNRIRTEKYEKSVDDEIVTIREPVFEDLANRFIKEIAIGNIREVCRHEAFNNPRFVNCFMDSIERLTRDTLCYILQVTEQEGSFGALFNGSLLYWSASLNVKHLLSSLLLRKFYRFIKDEFWVRIQASAALVPSCWFGYPIPVLELLLDLKADINSTLHEERRSQTHFCEHCIVHDKDGMTAIQATIFGENLHKNDTVRFLLQNGAHFKEKSKHRPLIQAIKAIHKESENDNHNYFATTIRTLLDGGVDANWADKYDRTAFWYAVNYDNVEIAKLLVYKSKRISSQSLLPFAKSIEMANLLVKSDVDKNFDQKDSDDKTLLHRVQHESLIQYFMIHGCLLEKRDIYGRTPIYYSSNETIFREFLANGASVFNVDCDGKTVLHFIKKIEILEHILKSLPIEDVRTLVNMEDKWKRTPMFTSITTPMLRMFLERQADVNHRANSFHTIETRSITQNDIISYGMYNFEIDPLVTQIKFVEMYTAKFVLSLPEIYSEIVHNENDLHEQMPCTDCTGKTKCTSVSSQESDVDNLVSYVSDDNLDANEVDHRIEGYTVAMKLAMSGKLTSEMAHALIENGIDFSVTDKTNNTIFHYILSPTHRLHEVGSIVQKIIDSLSKQQMAMIINIENSDGITALHLACSCKEINQLAKSTRSIVVGMLLQAGADKNATNDNGETPLHCLLKCTCSEQYEVATELLSHPFSTLDIYKQNKCREIPLEQLCTITKHSRRYLDDAQKTIHLLYRNEEFKQYFILNIEFFLTKCNMSLLQIVFSSCLGLNGDDMDVIAQTCAKDEHVRSVSAWLLFSLLDYPEKKQLFSKISFEGDEIHVLIKECIVEIHDRIRRLSVLSILFDQIDDINTRDTDGTPLFINALTTCRYRKNDMYGIMELFLKHGANPNVKDSGGLTPFHHCIMACVSDNCVVRCAELLQENKADLELGKPLLVAVDINRSRTKTIKFLLKNVSPDQRDENGNALHHLMIAYSKYGHSFQVSTTSISALVDRGVDINMYNDDGETPLHVAFKRHTQPHVIIEMLRNSADVNKKVQHNEMIGKKSDSTLYSDEGRSPFQYMLIHHHNTSLLVVKEMLKYGADPFQMDKNYQNAFHHITRVMKPFCLKIMLLILDKFESSNIYMAVQDIYGNTPLHYACTYNKNDKVWCSPLRVAVTRILIANGVNINVINSRGKTPFHLLVDQYHQYSITKTKSEHGKCIHDILSLITLFLAHKADMTVKEHKGRSVLDSIKLKGYSELEKLISGEKYPEDLIQLLDVSNDEQASTDYS